MKKSFLIIVLIIIVIGISVGIKNGINIPQNISIEEYVTQNISILSSQKEVLGGKFYVTKIEAQGGAGTVYYEDGHIALVADFTYTVDSIGSPNVTSFVIRK